MIKNNEDSFQSMFENEKFLNKKGKNNIFLKKAKNKSILNDYIISGNLKSPINLKYSNELVNN